MGDRAHERLVAVAHVRIDHLEVPLVHGQIDRLAYRAARVVQPVRGVGQLHEIAEVLDRAVAPAAVEVAHEGRAVVGGEDCVPAADDHVARRVAGVLDVFAGRGGPDQQAAEAAGEMHPLALHVGAGVLPDLQGFRIVLEVEADLFQHGLGIVLDQGQAFLGQHLVIGDVAGDEGDGVGGAGQARGPLGLASAAAAGACGWSLIGHVRVLVAPLEFVRTSPIETAHPGECRDPDRMVLESRLDV